MKDSFHEIIGKLIAIRHEGSYWDYKQEYHRNKADLLHDIICLTNNLADRDAYIIFGVSDNGDIFGVENDENRKSQENFTTFLRDKSFSEGYRPSIEYTQIKWNNHEIDILTIKNNSRTPYYLTNDFHDGKEMVKAYYIYTRVMDTNTPKDKSADVSNIETLWKKRFGLSPTPQKRLEQYLENKEQWIKRDQIQFYEESPEFTIEKVEDCEMEHRNTNQTREFYCFYQSNSSSYYAMIRCKYYSTTLFSSQIVILDSGRYTTPTPEWGFILFDKCNREKLPYKYFLKNSLDYKMNLFLYNDQDSEARVARNKFMEIVLVFFSDAEREEFETYIDANLPIITMELAEKKKKNLIFDGNIKSTRDVINERIHFGLLLNEKLADFREKSSFLKNI